MTVQYKALLENLKTDSAYSYSTVNGVNRSRIRLGEIISNEFKSLSRQTSALKTIIDITTDQEVSSGPGKLDLSKIQINDSNGLFVSDGRIIQLPMLMNQITPKEIRVNGIGDTYITVDESGEELVRAKTYFASDIKNGLEFQYQNNGFINISLFVDFNGSVPLSIITLDMDNTYSSQQTKIDSIYLTNGNSLKFKTVRNKDILYVLLEEEVDVSLIQIRMSSYAYIPQKGITLMKIKKLLFGTVGYNENSNITFGPIGSIGSKVIKVGIGLDKNVQGIKYSASTDLNKWYTFDVENEKGYSMSLNTIFSKSKNEKAYKVYIKVEVENKKESATKNYIEFNKFSGDDCYLTDLQFGSSSITNFAIQEFTQSVYDTKTEKFIYPEDMDQLRTYKISSTPFNPILENFDFIERYDSQVVIDPNSTKVILGSSIVPFTNTDTTYANYVYKMKESYLPGSYSYIVNGEKVKTFNIYGTYLFSLSKFILRVKTTDVVSVLFKNKRISKSYPVDLIATMVIDEENSYVTLAPLIIDETISYNPSYFYPYHFDEFESITENGKNIQNGYWVVPFSSATYPQDKTTVMSIRDIEIYSDFLRRHEEIVERTILFEAKHKKISSLDIDGTKNLVRVQFIDGESEFKEKKMFYYQKDVTGGYASVLGLKRENNIDIYTAGYARRFIRVYSIKDLVSDYSYYVEDGIVFFNEKMNGQLVNIATETSSDGKVLGDNYSVDYVNGVVYFSSFQNDIKIRYEYLDMNLVGPIYTEKNISSDTNMINVGVDFIEKEIITFAVSEIPTVSIGVIYD